MAGSRTIKTLTALLASMTVGAFALMLLASDPIIPPNSNLAAGFAPRDDDKYSSPAVRVLRENLAVPLRSWSGVVVHSSVGEKSDIAQRVHFVIDQDTSGRAIVTATNLWARQVDGRHVYVAGADWDAETIGIVVVGDLSKNAPSAAQTAELKRLLQAIRAQFGIDDAHICCHSQLGSQNPNCAKALQAILGN